MLMKKTRNLELSFQILNQMETLHHQGMGAVCARKEDLVFSTLI